MIIFFLIAAKSTLNNQFTLPSKSPLTSHPHEMTSFFSPGLSLNTSLKIITYVVYAKYPKYCELLTNHFNWSFWNHLSKATTAYVLKPDTWQSWISLSKKSTRWRLKKWNKKFYFVNLVTTVIVIWNVKTYLKIK